MSAHRLSALLCVSAMFAQNASAEEAFVTQLRLPARERNVDIFAWRDQDGVNVERSALTRLGIEAPAGGRIHLRDVPGLSYVEIDSASAIIITCTAACFATQRVATREQSSASPAAPWGGYVNYDLALDWREGDDTALGAILETNIFGPLGRGELSWLASEGRFARLETRWTIDAPAHRLRLQLGDSLWPSVGGGVMRFGGVQLGRHFALAPREITHPTPRLSGEAESASTVELYIDGALRARETVEAGPFELEDAPFVTGAGEAQLVVTDVLGRQQVVSRPFFVTTSLLRQGLSDWSIAAGVERRAFGDESASYGKRFAAGQYRLGLTDNLTAEAGAEWTDDGATAQVGAAFANVTVGQINLSYAQGADGGGAFAWAWRREARAWSFGVQGETRDADFNSLTSGEAPRQSAAANLSLRLGAYGDVSFTAVGAEFDDRPDAQSYAVSYTPDFDYASLNFRVAYTEALRTDLSLAVALSVPLRGDISASLAGQWDEGGARYRAGAQSSPQSAGGFGWRVRAMAGRTERADAALMYQGPYSEAQFSAGLSSAGGAARLELRGSLGWVSDQTFAARPIRGAFALVDAGASGVGISRDRLRIGVSGADGWFVASNLRPYDLNTIGIAAEDLPLDRAPALVAQRVAPQEGAGVLVRFTDTADPLVETHAKFATGADAPRGGTLVRARDGQRFPIGANGRVVLQGAADGDELRLESDATCRARGDAAAARSGLILQCWAAS